MRFQFRQNYRAGRVMGGRGHSLGKCVKVERVLLTNYPPKLKQLKTNRGPTQTPGETLLSIMAYGNIFPSFPLPLTLPLIHIHSLQYLHANSLFVIRTDIWVPPLNASTVYFQWEKVDVQIIYLWILWIFINIFSPTQLEDIYSTVLLFLFIKI